MDGPWLLLIYTVPAEPSRKRAFVWRKIKRVGAVYLRDGVCVLPQTPAAESALSAIAQRILGFEGRATVVRDAQLEADQAREVTERMLAARAGVDLAEASPVSRRAGEDLCGRISPWR